MGLLGRIFGRRRRSQRLVVDLPVILDTQNGEKATGRTQDLSESGLRMDITQVSSITDLTGGHRDVGLDIVLGPNEAPVRVMAEPIWTVRQEDGTQSSGWMFCDFLNGSRERLAAFIDTQLRSGGQS
ncbi:MAG: PilZ domain-containing protein [bacterium]|nr:PilZ domain-containing protein [bacterium]